MPKTFAKEPFVLCFTRLLLAKKIMDKGGGYPDFPSGNFCLTMQKIFAGEPFCAVLEKNSGSEKLYG